jgi:hypothetical protein
MARGQPTELRLPGRGKLSIKQHGGNDEIVKDRNAIFCHAFYCALQPGGCRAKE